MATKPTKKSTKSKPNKAPTKQSLRQRIAKLRADRKQRKAEIRKHKQTDEARKAKAEKRAVREKALAQVNEAVIRSKQRRSYPGFTILALVIIACLAGALVWQYRQEEIDQNLQDISALQLEISSFDNQRSAIEAEQRIEDAKFQNIAINFDSEQGSEDSATVRVPTEWTTKPTQFPGSEVVIGDENVTFRIISSESRNTTAQYIPVVDYIWKIDGNGTNITVLSQSLNCERFDTLGNDLSDEQREHQGFVVYCDESSERVVIAALAAPSGYGVGNNNDYFIIEIEDAQQVSFKAIKNYLESYSL